MSAMGDTENQTEITNPLPDADIAHPQKRNLRPIVISAIAIVLVIAITAGMLTNWFGFYGPATKILLAAGRTFSASSFTACIELHVGSFSPDPIQLQGQIDTNERTVTLVGRYAEDSIVRFAVYDGFLIRRTGLGRYTARDIHSELNEFFDSMERKDDIDWAELLQTISQSIYDQYGDRLNYDEIEPGLLSLLRTCNNPKWLKSTAGLTVQRTGSDIAYCFSPDTYAAASSALSCFEGVFTEKEDYTSLTDGLADQQKALESAQLSLQFLVSGGYLTKAEISAQRNDIPLSAQISFDEIGSTQIDFEELTDLLSSASKA